MAKKKTKKTEAAKRKASPSSARKKAKKTTRKTAKKKRKGKLSAGSLFDFLDLSTMRLIDLQAKLELSGDERDTKTRFDLGVGVFATPDNHVLVNATLNVNSEGDVADREPELSVKAVYQCVYHVEGAEASDLLKYSDSIAQYSMREIWPYSRELVHSTTVRMGLPPIVLPAFAEKNMGKNAITLKKDKD